MSCLAVVTAQDPFLFPPQRWKTQDSEEYEAEGKGRQMDVLRLQS